MPTLNLSLFIGRNTVNYRVASTTGVQRLRSAVADHLGLPDSSKLRILFDFNPLGYNRTLEQHGVHDGDELFCLYEQAGGYIGDALYIKSPVDIPQLSLEIALASGISTEYISMPGAHLYTEGRRAIEWSGSVKGGQRDFGYKSSTLQERDSGHEGPGLAWSASLDANAPEGSLARAQLTLDDTRAALVQYKDVAQYITKTLSALSLDESDIERFFLKYYWRLVEQPYVAIRFVEQEIYEQIMPLAISPPPDVITRVVMLFQGVNEVDAASWNGARERAQLGPRHWKDAIGYDERTTDSSLYRALEWRVIEVPAASNTV